MWWEAHADGCAQIFFISKPRMWWEASVYLVAMQLTFSKPRMWWEAYSVIKYRLTSYF